MEKRGAKLKKEIGSGPMYCVSHIGWKFLDPRTLRVNATNRKLIHTFLWKFNETSV